MLQLYLASEDDADAIAAGEYVAPPGWSLRLPDDLGVDDLAALDRLFVESHTNLGERHGDPGYSVLDDEAIAEWEDVAVYQVKSEFIERLSGWEEFGTDRCPDINLRRWTEFLNGGDQDGVWTPEKTGRVARRLATLARRALKRELSLLILVGRR